MVSKPTARKPLTLKHSAYQPSKAELEEEIRLDVPGRDAHERARNLARTVLQTVKIRFDKKK